MKMVHIVTSVIRSKPSSNEILFRSQYRMQKVWYNEASCKSLKKIEDKSRQSRQNKMEMTTMMFKWRTTFSREGIASTNLHFSQLQESSFYLKQIIRPYYIALISNFNAINEFSLATSTFDMSSAVWLVIFIYEENSTDYCHNPPEMLVRCGTENILREWYSIDTDQIEINDIATWSLEKGISKIITDSLYERRHNLHGLIMKAVIVKDSPFLNVRKSGQLDGIFSEILREICITLNFSFNIVSEVEEYGRWNPKQKIWTGAIAELYAGHVDIALSGFTITSARLNAVDFTHPVFKTKNFLVIREPEKFGIKWSSYFQTFTNTVWIAILGILMTASILLIFPKIKSGIDRKIGYLFIDNFLEIWGIFCQQGLADFSGESSLKIAYFSIFLLVTVLSAAYSAGLISFLTSTIHILPFHSLESFVQDGNYQLVVVRGTAFYDKFANSRDPLGKKIMKLMLEEEKLPVTQQEGYERICKNQKLAIYSIDQDNIVNLKIPCNVVRIATGHVNSIAMTLSKHNQFTDVINFQLRKYDDNGMMDRLKQTIFKKKSNSIIKHQPVPLISVISLLILFLIGIILSTCILIIENFIFVRKTKKMSMVRHIPSLKSSGFYVKRKKSLRNIAKYHAIRSYEFLSISNKQIPFIIDICKLYGQKSAILLYPEFEKEMEMTTMMFKWRCAFSREGIATTNLRFSQLHESLYYIKQIVRPFYIMMISDYNAMREFSLATSTFDISVAMWLVIFMYKGDDPDYCHNPPEMLVRCDTENILREWYSIDTRQVEINDVVTWSLEKGITKIVPNFLYERRHNLQGLIMRAVIVKDSPFTKINKNGELDGIYGRILRELCVTLNFSFDIVSEVEEYGRWNSTTKTWSGAIAELYYGRADISLSEFSMSNARLNAVDFTIPIFNSKDCLFFEKPEIFATFNHSVWIAMFGVLIAVSILLIFFKKKNGTDCRIGHLLSDNFLEIWGIFCQQGIAESSDRFSLRIAYFSIFLLITILSAAYSAALISFLTTMSNTLPFDSLETFVQDGTYRLTVFRGTAHYDKFANSEDPLAKKLMKLMLEENKLPLTALEGFTSICKNRKLVIYTYNEMKKPVDSKITCNVVRVKTEHVNNIAIALSKYNPFTDVINFQLQKFFENGMMNRLKNSPFEKKSNDIIKHQPVTLIGVISLFIFIQIGIIISICILAIEKNSDPLTLTAMYFLIFTIESSIESSLK
ncbi:putative glutamate receptor isoform X1 [Vespula maculifrons]|uniref:Glutamate receptor isoform X1 n=1 Tax=Vespula maculifrons TaxID=7453 RepID=A0ABD2CXE9_VESMC